MSSLLDGYTTALQRCGEKNLSTVEGKPSRTFTLNDLLLSQIRQEDRSTSTILTFVLFERDFILLDEDELVMMEEGEYFEVSDEDLQKAIKQYLTWRLKVLTKLDM